MNFPHDLIQCSAAFRRNDCAADVAPCSDICPTSFLTAAAQRAPVATPSVQSTPVAATLSPARGPAKQMNEARVELQPRLQPRSYSVPIIAR